MKSKVNNFAGNTLEAVSTGLFIASSVVDVINKKTFRKNNGQTLDQYLTDRLATKTNQFNDLSQRIEAMRNRKVKTQTV